MYKGVVFDLDGTLLNTLDDLANAGNYMLDKFNLPPYEVEKYKYFVGNGIPVLVERLLGENLKEQIFSKAFKIFSDYYKEHMQDKTAPYSGISSLLTKLENDGVKMGVATNKRHKLAVEVVDFYFEGKIKTVYGESEQIPPKPDPTSVLKMIDEFKLPKSEILYVGDTSVDMQTAKNAGLTACGVLWGFRTKDELITNGADIIAANTDELYKIISE